MPEPVTKVPTVFISYSHDSPEHADRVLTFSDALRDAGINTILDQYEPFPAEGWPRWMDKHVRDADFVLMVCTETYYRRVMGEETPGVGLGVRWEGNLLYNHFYVHESLSTRFVPVLLEGGQASHIPSPFLGVTHYSIGTFDLSNRGYEDLYRRLTDQPRVVKPELGKLHRLERRERREDFLGPVWNVPDRNVLFTGREDVLDALRDRLAGGGRVALSGLGGMGKTQTAIEFTHQHRSEYRAVLWVRAETREELTAEIAGLARLLDLPQKNEADQSVVVAAVKRWLETNANWLLVLDNADDVNVGHGMLPSPGIGHVLFTTRAQNTIDVAPRVRLTEMDADTGARLLLRRAGLLEGEADLDAADAGDVADARALSDELDGLPLALDQAGAYIATTFATIADYRDRYRLAGDRLRARRGTDVPGEHDSVTKTFSLAFARLTAPERSDKDDDPELAAAKQAAADLVRLCAFLAPDAIPEEIVIEGAPNLSEDVQRAVADPLLYDDMMAQAGRYSLLERDPKARTLSIHRLVQEVLKDEMSEAEQRDWAERAVRAVNRAFPDPEFMNWPDCDRFLPHARECAKLVDRWHIELDEAARMLNQTGYYLRERGQYAEAEPLYSRALSIRESVLGPEHPDTAGSLNNLAMLYQDQGKLSEAEPLYHQAAQVMEAALGLTHPNVATVLGNYATLLERMERTGETEELRERARAVREAHARQNAAR